MDRYRRETPDAQIHDSLNFEHILQTVSCLTHEITTIILLMDGGGMYGQVFNPI